MQKLVPFIKDPIFTRKHLQFQKMASKNNGHFLLLLRDHLVDGVFNYFVFDGKSITSRRTSSCLLPSYRNLFRFSKEMYDQFKIDGPVNGLYCLHNRGGHIVIWNPATNEVSFVPLHEPCLPADDYDRSWSSYLYCGVVGFGIDPLDEEDYKVVLICYYTYTDGDDKRSYSMIYTTKTNSWRLLNNDLPVINPLNNTYLNGFYYWMSERNCTALSFDMSKKETFQWIPTPYHGNLALHDDHITMFDINRNLNEIDIWMMLDGNNWSKKFSVKGIHVPVVYPLGFWKIENDLFLVIGDCMSFANTQAVLHDTTTREIRNLGPEGYSADFKTIVYYESLVSRTGGIIKFKGNDIASSLDTICDFLGHNL